MTKYDFTRLAAIAGLALLLTTHGVIAANSAPQRTFETAEAAVQAMLDALSAGDENALLDVFGQQHADQIIGTDRIAARVAWEKVYDAASEMHVLREDGPDSRTLVIGRDAWPSPIPLVRADGRWRFDTDAGIEEIINRRVGRNELNAINVCSAYIDAQRLYASADRDDDEVREYAQRLGSTPGTKDGLFWETDTADQELSPFGPLVAGARDYLDGRKESDPFKGYYFRILTRQGIDTPGGQYDYVINGNMIGGFALLAYPADWGQSGVMTFVCSHHGKTYEKELGPGTFSAAKAIHVFNPDDSWHEVGE